MIRRPEAPNPVADDQPVIELTEGGGYRTIPRKGRKEDPLYNLFVYDKSKKHGTLNLVIVMCDIYN